MIFSSLFGISDSEIEYKSYSVSVRCTEYEKEDINRKSLISIPVPFVVLVETKGVNGFNPSTPNYIEPAFFNMYEAGSVIVRIPRTLPEQYQDSWRNIRSDLSQQI